MEAVGQIVCDELDGLESDAGQRGGIGLRPHRQGRQREGEARPQGLGDLGPHPHGRQDGGPCAQFCRRQDGVLEVENQAVGRQGSRLHQSPGIAAGDVQDGAAGQGQRGKGHGTGRIPEASGMTEHLNVWS